MKAYIVDRQALENNIRILKEKAGDTVIWGVVKGDGYGLGCANVARVLAENGVDHFAVTSVSEVRALRSEGFRDEPILMMETVSEPDEIDELLDLDAIFTVGSPGAAAAVNEAATRRSTVAQAHLKIDTGMGRYGFLLEQLPQLLDLYTACPNVAFSGVYTHFCDSGNPDSAKAQFGRFQEVIAKIRDAGFETGMVHCCNSTAFWNYPQMHCDAVRIGSAILGRVNFSADTGLQKIGWCRAGVEEVRIIPKGHSVGYGSGWTAKRQTTIAILPVGYFNGFAVDRGYDLWRFRDCVRGALRYVKAFLQRKALYVSVNGKPCRVLGHVGMVNLVIDVTGRDCRPGDTAWVEINPLLVKGMDIVFE